VARLVNEPTAASLAFGLKRLGRELRIVAIDLGGGSGMNQRIFERLAECSQNEVAG